MSEFFDTERAKGLGRQSVLATVATGLMAYGAIGAVGKRSNEMESDAEPFFSDTSLFDEVSVGLSFVTVLFLLFTIYSMLEHSKENNKPLNRY